MTVRTPPTCPRDCPGCRECSNPLERWLGLRWDKIRHWLFDPHRVEYVDHDTDRFWSDRGL